MLMATATRSDPLGASVLVLNRLYMAVHVVGVRRAFGLLCREIAEVVHLEEGKFANYDFHGWREISELRADDKQPNEDWIRAVNFEIQVPRVIRLLFYDRTAQAVVAAEPPQRVGPGRASLPVLRPSSEEQPVEHGPRDSSQPRRAELLGTTWFAPA